MKNTISLVSSLCLAIFFSFAATDAKAQFQAKLFTVDSVNDSHDASPGDRLCADENGECTLRAAIEETNLNPGQRDVINFALPDPSVIDLTLGELVITGRVYLAGPGARRLTVQRSTTAGTPNFRIFHIAGYFGQDPVIHGLRIQNGNSDGDGGGIKIEYTAQMGLTEVWITGNRARAGGGIANSGRLTIEGSLISSNTAELRSTKGKGGGIEILSGGGASIYNSTITLNRANTSGAVDASGWVELANDTIAGNFAAADCTSICVHSSQVSIINTIIGPDTEAAQRNALSGLFFSYGYNIVTDARGATGLTNGVRYDQISDSNAIDPRLGELANNGGQTDTLSLLNQSPAINAGDVCVVYNDCQFPIWVGELYSDQRSRYSRFSQVDMSERADVGAFQHGSTEVSYVSGWPGRISIDEPRGPGTIEIFTDIETNQKYYFRFNPFGYPSSTNMPNRIYAVEFRSKEFGLASVFPGVVDLRGLLGPYVTNVMKTKNDQLKGGARIQ